MPTRENKTGLPAELKEGIENLSSHLMDDLRVHYNSTEPTQLNAHAYEQGNEIHLSPEEQQQLPHKAWHVVQQKQSNIKIAIQLKGNPINNEKELEKEAEDRGLKAGS